ncbi:hypothetical protein V5N11_010088 [Cardamine amara subsp. amara]|uniref:Uncharacterized protein n=1 Tax=Cardamine amara subsp. amara TaxID=228776 RepID=A0ABD1AMV5_CARAN
MEVSNGKSTVFWYDHWYSLGRLIDITGEIGFIDLGIPKLSTVESVLCTQRRKRHRVEIWNRVENTY